LNFSARNEVVWGPVPSTEEVSRDLQMRLNGVFPEMEPGLHTVNSPINLAGTVEALRGLGYSDEAIQQMMQAGAVC